MSDATLTTEQEIAVPAKLTLWQRYEFLLFSITGFVAKSYLLIRLPYRPWYKNAMLTGVILLFFYGYFRFRFKAKPPLLIVFCLVLAITLDVIGNLFGLYSMTLFGIAYDDYTHFMGSACSLFPVMWVFRTTTRRIGVILPADMVAFLSTCITFSLCAWYEILELWDELFYGDFTRIWTTQDTAKDLQWDLAGIVLAACIGTLIFQYLDRRAARAMARA